MSLLQHFSSCILKPYCAEEDQNSTSNTTPIHDNANSSGSICSSIPFSSTATSGITINSKGKYSVNSLYLDSFGTTNVTVPFKLNFPSQEIMNQFITAQCIQPMPSNYNSNESKQQEKKIDNDTSTTIQKTIALEAKVLLTFGTGHAITSKVERVTIVSTYVDNEENHNNSIIFYTEIMVRVFHVRNDDDDDDDGDENDGESKNNRLGTTTTMSDIKTCTRTNGIGCTILDPDEASNIKLHLEVTATYSEYTHSETKTGTKQRLMSNETQFYESALQQLLPQQHHLPNQITLAPIVTKRSVSPISIHVSLIHALQITVRSAPGPTIGQTFLAISMKHSNHHPHVVHITNISLHPSVSAASSVSRKKLSIENRKDVSVLWGFVTSKDGSSSLNYSTTNTNTMNPDGTLLSIKPNESQSTLLYIHATKESETTNNCSCPLTIAFTLEDATNKDNNNKKIVDENIQPTATIVLTSNVQYSACCTAIESSNSFKIKMSIVSSTTTNNSTNDSTATIIANNNDSSISPTVMVGKLMTLQLKIVNLGSETHQLQLIMDNYSYDDSRDNASCTTSSSTIFSERQQDGSTFRMIGPEMNITSNHNGHHQHNRDLILIDPIVSVGEIQGYSSITTSVLIRMIPLHIGTIPIPNFTLMDIRSGKKYYCYHQMQIVVVEQS